MSALLEGLADASGRIPFSLSGDSLIDHVSNGIPFDSNGSVAASLNGIIDHYHQGLPFDATGRLVITTDDVVRYGSGAAPFDADNALCAAGTPPVVRWANGVPYTDNGKIAGADVSVYEFVFNGTDQYATMPGWTPNGLPFEIRVEATLLTVDGTTRYVVTNANGSMRLSADTSDRIQGRYNATAGQQIMAVPSPLLSSGESFTATLEANGAGGRTTFQTGSATKEEPALYPQTPLSDIGGLGLTGLFHGPIKALLLADNSPIQDTYANASDGVRYGALEQPVPLSSANAYVEFVYATGDQTILDGSVPVLTVVTGVLTGGVNVSSILLDGAAYAGAALTVGQHYRIEFDVDGGDIDTFGPLASGGMMANLQIEGDV